MHVISLRVVHSNQHYLMRTYHTHFIGKPVLSQKRILYFSPTFSSISLWYFFKQFLNEKFKLSLVYKVPVTP